MYNQVTGVYANVKPLQMNCLKRAFSIQKLLEDPLLQQFLFGLFMNLNYPIRSLFFNVYRI